MPTTASRHGLLGALALLLLWTAASAVSAPAADAAAKTCKPRAGTVHRDGATRIWHQRGSLFACTTLTRTGLPKTTRLGPWTPGGVAVANSSYVAWTTKRRNNVGARMDRLWSASVDGRRWLAGARAIPAYLAAPSQEGQVERLLITDSGAAWVTRTSEVVLAVSGAGVYDPSPIGTLPAALAPSEQTMLVGSWPAVPAATLAATAQLRSENGETDDCGGSRIYELTVAPDAAAGPVGARWGGPAPVDPDICNV